MNVAIFASAFHPHLGGVEELVRQLAHAYADREVRAIVITHQWPPELPAHETFEGIEVFRLPMPMPHELNGAKAHLKSRYLVWKNRAQNCAAIEEILRRHETEVLHVQCVSGNGFYALAAARALGLPLVVTAQGELSMDASHLYQRSPVFRAMLRDVLEAADFITACSQSTLAELEAFYGSSFGQRARAIYNGIALDDFQDVPPRPHARPYLLGIGRLVQQKGFDVLLHAFARAREKNGLEGFDLLLAGEGSEQGALENLLSELKLEGHAHLIGRAGRDEAMALFKGCAFFVLPSRHEPQGIVNLEAMAAGKAVIATRVGGVPEIVLENQTGILVAPDNPSSLARAMSTLAADPGLALRLGEAGRARAQNFSWPAIADHYLDIYQAVIRQRSSQATGLPSVSDARVGKSQA
jgi:glycogen(starch) synthase